jgi:ketopantoate hydroxymethyltransferase
VLVLYDILDTVQVRKPKFIKSFIAGKDSPLAAVRSYVKAVKDRRNPEAEHCVS